MSPISSNRYDEAILTIEIIKKVTEENARGWYPPTPGRPRVNKVTYYHIFDRTYSMYKAYIYINLKFLKDSVPEISF